MFSSTQDDDSTKRRMSTFENVMDQFSRFQIQLIAYENKIPFKYGVTTKPSIINMMKEENMKVPTLEQMQQYMQNHRDRTRGKVVGKEKPSAGVSADVAEIIVEDEDEDEEEDNLSTLKRPALMTLAAKYGVPNTFGTKNVDLIKAINNVKKSLGTG